MLLGETRFFWETSLHAYKKPGYWKSVYDEQADFSNTLGSFCKHGSQIATERKVREVIR